MQQSNDIRNKYKVVPWSNGTVKATIQQKIIVFTNKEIAENALFNNPNITSWSINKDKDVYALVDNNKIYLACCILNYNQTEKTKIIFKDNDKFNLTNNNIICEEGTFCDFDSYNVPKEYTIISKHDGHLDHKIGMNPYWLVRNNDGTEHYIMHINNDCYALISKESIGAVLEHQYTWTINRNGYIKIDSGKGLVEHFMHDIIAPEFLEIIYNNKKLYDLRLSNLIESEKSKITKKKIESTYRVKILYTYKGHIITGGKETGKWINPYWRVQSNSPSAENIFMIMNCGKIDIFFSEKSCTKELILFTWTYSSDSICTKVGGTTVTFAEKVLKQDDDSYNKQYVRHLNNNRFDFRLSCITWDKIILHNINKNVDVVNDTIDFDNTLFNEKEIQTLSLDVKDMTIAELAVHYKLIFNLRNRENNSNCLIKNFYNTLIIDDDKIFKGHVGRVGVFAHCELNPYWLVYPENDPTNKFYAMYCNSNNICYFSIDDLNIVLTSENKMSQTWYVNKELGYVLTSKNNGTLMSKEYMHVLIQNNKGEIQPPDTSVDHINRIKTDNRRSNLRYATQSLQNTNRDKPSRPINAKPLPSDVNNTVKYIQFCNESEKRQFYVVDYPGFKRWYSSKSMAIPNEYKFQAAKNYLSELESGLHLDRKLNNNINNINNNDNNDNNNNDSDSDNNDSNNDDDGEIVPVINVQKKNIKSKNFKNSFI